MSGDDGHAVREDRPADERTPRATCKAAAASASAEVGVALAAVDAAACEPTEEVGVENDGSLPEQCAMGVAAALTKKKKRGKRRKKGGGDAPGEVVACAGFGQESRQPESGVLSPYDEIVCDCPAPMRGHPPVRFIGGRWISGSVNFCRDCGGSLRSGSTRTAAV